MPEHVQKWNEISSQNCTAPIQSITFVRPGEPEDPCPPTASTNTGFEPAADKAPIDQILSPDEIAGPDRLLNFKIE